MSMGRAAEAQLTSAPLTIFVRGLDVFAHHGMVEEERAVGQRFEIDVEVDVADCEACRTDDATDAVAYEALVAVVVEVTTNFRFSLMEALADAICTELLMEFPITAVRLVVAKAAPRIPHNVVLAGVRMERLRDHVAQEHGAVGAVPG